MKKRIMFILFMSALLCLSILFVACDNGEVSSPTDTATSTENISETATQTETELKTETEETETETFEVTETETEEPETDDLSIPEDESVNYGELLGQWEQYMTSVGKEEKPVYSNKENVFTITYRPGQTAPVYGSIAVVKTIEYGGYDYETGEYIPDHTSYTLYNIEKNKYLGFYQQNDLDDLLNMYKESYQINVLLDTIIEVKKITLDIEYGTRIEIINGEEKTVRYVENWDYVYQYSYYDNDGNTLAANLDEPATVTDNGNVAAVAILDKAYHCRDGEIILVGDSENIYAIPDFTMEYLNYRYAFRYDVIQVINSEYELLVDYTVPSYVYDEMTYKILSNGDIYICSIVEVGDDVASFDLEYEGEKYDIVNMIVKVSTGEVSEIELPFILASDKLWSNYYTETSGIQLKGDYQYAEIWRIEDGKLNDNTEFVILDNNLAEIASLPAILKNQTSLVKGMGNSLYLIDVENVYGSSVSYVFDYKDGSLERYISSDRYYRVIDNGFIYENCVYNEKLEELYTISDYYEIKGGAIMYYVPEIYTESYYNEYTGEYEYYETTRYNVYVGRVTRSGEFESSCLSYDTNVSYIGNQLYTVQGDNVQLYNRNGERIYFDDLWNVTSISVASVFEDGVVVRVTSKEYTYEDGYETEYTRIGYYVIK